MTSDAEATTQPPRQGPKTWVYVSCAQDGEIRVLHLDRRTGTLEDVARVPAGPSVMPLAVSPDRRFLFAAIRSQPYRVASWSIDPATGGLSPLGTAPMPDSMAYLSTDRSGAYLFAASYAGDLISLHAIDDEGRVAQDPLQEAYFGRHAHAVVVDPGNRHVYATNLGSDQVVQLRFDARRTLLEPMDPPVVRVTPGAGPRHPRFSPDGRFLFVLNELNGHVTVFAIDPSTGRLSQRGSMLAVPRDAGLVPGKARAPVGGPPASVATATPEPASEAPPIWAADLAISPDGRFLYASERTTSTVSLLRVDPATATMQYAGYWPTEEQPRSIALDPSSRWLLAAGERSGQLSVHRVDPKLGTLTQVSRHPVGAAPAWVEIVSFSRASGS